MFFPPVTVRWLRGLQSLLARKAQRRHGIPVDVLITGCVSSAQLHWRVDLGHAILVAILVTIFFTPHPQGF